MSYTMIEELASLSEQFDRGKHDWTAPLNQIQLARDASWVGLLEPNDEGRPIAEHTLEDHAQQQLLARLSSTYWQLPVKHHRDLRSHFPELFTWQMNAMLKGAPARDVLVRTHDGNARAILSDRYASIDNTHLLDVCAQFVQDADYELRRCILTRDTLRVTILVKTVASPYNHGQTYGLGFELGNDETGRGAAFVRPRVWRTSCDNSMTALRDEEGNTLGVHLRHIGNAELKVGLLGAAITEVLPQSEEVLAAFLDGVNTKVPDITATIAKLGKRYGWSEDLAYTVAVGTEGHASLSGLVNGITYAAHQHPGISWELAEELELQAGNLLFNPETLS